ncbi:MAG: glutamate synthase large subunit [Gammaproteobacteria bacterium]
MIATQGLYDSQHESSACGVGLVAHLEGRPSNRLLQTALESVRNMEHRGVLSEDGLSGDGCGILMQKPDLFLRQQAKEHFGREPAKAYAVGSIFVSKDSDKAHKARTRLETELERVGLMILGWRPVPVNTAKVGPRALDSMPDMWQLFINSPRPVLRQFMTNLFIARRRAEIALKDDPDFYVASLSPRLLSYKGMMVPEHLPAFFPDLADDTMQTSICVYHQRFATNTMPRWERAQPYRLLAHNGEINTINGNRHWANARLKKLLTPQIPDLESLMPLVAWDSSDSATMDNMLELLQTGSMNLLQALRLLMPPAWQNLTHIDMAHRAFYEYCSAIMEPWDGPACLAITDGRHAIAALDRNGLRPARYTVSKNNYLTVASETGVYDYKPEDIIDRGCLGPGDILALDTRTGKIRHTENIDKALAERFPYRKWWRERCHRLQAAPEVVPNYARPIAKPDAQAKPSENLSGDNLLRAKKLFQFTLEEQEQLLRPLAENGQEGSGSMGDDTPLPALSDQVRPLYDSFRQRFAQVTNPPIDSLRESSVMSLECFAGKEHNLFQFSPEHAHKVILQTPLLSPYKHRQLLKLENFPHQVLTLCFTPETESLKQAIARLTLDAISAVRNGATLLILREKLPDKDELPVHILLATGAIHHALTKENLRCDASLILETASARDSHQIACLIGFGATAVYPWLVYDLLADLCKSGYLADSADISAEKYRKGINKGLLKILSKMGISTISSYRGAQLFSAPGLAQEIIDLCFTGLDCHLGGMDFDDLQADAEQLRAHSLKTIEPISVGGIFKYVSGNEQHAFGPEIVTSLQKAAQTGDYGDWQTYADLVNTRTPLALRDLLQPIHAKQPLPLEQVEPVSSICSRIDSAGMSLGALSPEAHQDLAKAMNSLGAHSNSGEGGEDAARFNTDANSAIKQIASGRFGVTPHYMRHAKVLQIKIAQGAKPGEGGQLPGRKVNALIARLRYSVPGVTLISPPPHHDIYSIEDLKQLIDDLKQVNPDALVSVKLVSSPGIGTIAAGVAKAGADLITVSGYDGGTAASPLTSIRYAGEPWELGLAETQQALVANNLRSILRLQADGGLKTGLDVIKAALLGADSFGFGTAPMISLGCKYLRICHLNNCPTGVATQHARLRAGFYNGTYTKTRNFFSLLAEEVRIHLSALGFSNLQEIIGRTELLQELPQRTGKRGKLNLKPLLHMESGTEDSKRFISYPPKPKDSPLTQKMLQACLPHLDTGTGALSATYSIRNSDRSVGTRLAGEIAARYGTSDLPDKSFQLHFTGIAGQSFGAFNAQGMNLSLTGECNDYVGKGMAGGQIVLVAPTSDQNQSHLRPIMGNTCLYGATNGYLYAAGCAGQRFAVRNSGATAVVEGVGEHGCEYMTGGQIVILGQVGNNFAAGMTGGFSYVLDVEQRFVDACNREMVSLHRITGEEMEAHRTNLFRHIQQHVQLTQSARGASILADFDYYTRLFWLITPKATSTQALLRSERSEAA